MMGLGRGFMTGLLFVGALTRGDGVSNILNTQGD